MEVLGQHLARAVSQAAKAVVMWQLAATARVTSSLVVPAMVTSSLVVPARVTSSLVAAVVDAAAVVAAVAVVVTLTLMTRPTTCPTGSRCQHCVASRSSCRLYSVSYCHRLVPPAGLPEASPACLVGLPPAC